MEVSPFSDIYTVLSISECERGFSCMSTVKTTLRNRLTNTILQGLMMVSIHAVLEMRASLWLARKILFGPVKN
jgi:hypothetical protein